MVSKSSVVKTKFVENRIQGYLDEIFKPRGINLKLSSEGILTFAHHTRSFKLEVFSGIGCLIISTKFDIKCAPTRHLMKDMLELNRSNGPLVGSCLSLNPSTNLIGLHYRIHLPAVNVNSLENLIRNFIKVSQFVEDELKEWGAL